MDDGPSICEVGGGGLFLPIGGDGEQRWPTGIRAVLYFLGLGWCFMGVALIADVFMGAIETITSKKARKKNAKTGRMVTVLVWNPTVANLTLMALGSSAPEILLSLIELAGKNFFSGDLGPSTIVGSAAFNLLIITAVCVVVIPDKEVRVIKEMPVYCITASSSILAYLWLLVILMGISRNVVEWWEGLLTFLFFPLLVCLAYLADKGYFSKVPKIRTSHVVSSEMTKEELAALENNIRRKHGANLTDAQVAKYIAAEHGTPTSRAAYRVAATRDLTGGKRVNVPPQSATGTQQSLPLNSVMPFEGAVAAPKAPEEEDDTHSVYFEFEAMKYAVLESVGDMTLSVRRKGNLQAHASVGVRTRDGTAKSNMDYKQLDTRLEFAPGVEKQSVTLHIIDDAANEDNEWFFLDLHEPHANGTGSGLGDIVSTTVVIIDDDLPGTLEFQEDETLTVPEQVQDFNLDVIVQRSGGSTGKVSCSYMTEDGTAIADADYTAAQGDLEFEHGQMTATIKLTIKASGRYERSENFRIILSDPKGGARFDPKTDGGADTTILTVVIQSEQTAKARIDKLMSIMQVNWDKTKVGHANWRDQFVSALYVNGGDDDEAADPTLFDRFMHAVLLPWKLLFALVPPTDYMDGWLCFVSALAMIGLLTAVIGDMAALLGCVLTIPDAITAITFVALGTSLPDTFASKVAAIQDPFADASIGNVTGSNSVNVFLGLGLPWTMAAIYWQSGKPNDEWVRRYADMPEVKDWQDGAFIVIAGGLGFSVAVFSCCAITCIILLYIRRRCCGGELGGPVMGKYVTSLFLVILWITYIALSSWYTLQNM
mmetsp:Transcript_114708/g.319473  ORF Transcript_114708/g.319473 Transcript_114708/m.319473 type:complete len:825 (+) Transcript_114708:95-2569(+)